MPFRLDHLTQLESLELTLDRLTDLPVSIGRLTRLESLKVMFYGDQANLEYLDLSYSRALKEIPARLSQLKQLQELELCGTPISDLNAVPFRRMKHLERINLEDTEVSSAVKKKIQRQTPKYCSFQGELFTCHF